MLLALTFRLASLVQGNGLTMINAEKGSGTPPCGKMAGYDKVQGNSAKTRHCHQLAANMPRGIADWWKASNEGQVSRDETFSRQNQLHILSAIFPGKLLPGVTDAAKRSAELIHYTISWVYLLRRPLAVPLDTSH